MKYFYKIVAALGALATIPLIIFVKLFYIKMTSTALQAITTILQITGSDIANEIMKQTGGKVPNAIAESLSFYDIYNTAISLKGLASNGDGLGDKFDVLIAPAIVFAVIIVMIIICAIVTAVFAIFAKNNRKVIYSSIVGIGLSMMANETFECLAAPILEGTVSLSSVLGTIWAELIGTIDTFSLIGNFWFIPAIFGAIILWTVLYNYTLPDSEKRERKLMLGEFDEE